MAMVEAKLHTLQKSKLSKPIPPRVYPRDEKRYPLMPVRYTLPDSGPEPPSTDMNVAEFIHIDSGATIVCNNISD